MTEIELDLSEIAAAINGAIESLVSLLNNVITQIGNEVGVFMSYLIWNFDYVVVELVNILADYDSDTWYFVGDLVERFNLYIYELGYFLVQRINQTVQQFNALSNLVALSIEQELNQIDESITEQYQQRVFAIYGKVGQLSIAINAPPSYLEDAIQNARIFVLSVSAYVGLSYAKFQLDWYIGLNNLLNHINNSIALYRINPQQIRVDLENLLIKPAFEIKAAAQRNRAEQAITFTDNFTQLDTDINELRLSVLENKQEATDLWELTIKPQLKEIVDNFDKWTKEVYQKRVEKVNNDFAFYNSILYIHWEEIESIVKRLRFGGSLLQAIDLLPNIQRSEQESKIAEVASRTFRRNTDVWLDVVKEKRAT